MNTNYIKITVGLLPVAALILAWILHRIEHLSVHGFFTAISKGGDPLCSLFDGFFIIVPCIVGVGWGINEAINAIQAEREKS